MLLEAVAIGTVVVYIGAALYDALATGAARARALGPLAWLAITMIAFSYFVANLYRIFPTPDVSEIEAVAYAVTRWQIGLALLACATGACAIAIEYFGYRTQGRSFARLVFHCLAVSIVLWVALDSLASAGNDPGEVVQQRHEEMRALVCITLLGVLCCTAVPWRMWIALVLWLVVMVGEGLEATLYHECNMAWTIAEPRGTTSSCGRLFGPLGDWLLPMFDAIALTYLGRCVFFPR